MGVFHWFLWLIWSESIELGWAFTLSVVGTFEVVFLYALFGLWNIVSIFFSFLTLYLVKLVSTWVEINALD